MERKDIKLIEVEKEHIELIRQWRNSPEVSKYMYSDEYIREEEQDKWFKKISNDQTSKYWIVEYDNKKIGVASLTQINLHFSSCYWAFYLGDTSNRGAGIGAKIEFNVLSYVFESLGLNKLRAEVFAYNDKVVKMHEKFGFRREAYYREHCPKNGKFEDVVGIGLLKSEWNQLKPSLKSKIYGDDR